MTMVKKSKKNDIRITEHYNSKEKICQNFLPKKFGKVSKYLQLK